MHHTLGPLGRSKTLGKNNVHSKTLEKFVVVGSGFDGRNSVVFENFVLERTERSRNFKRLTVSAHQNSKY